MNNNALETLQTYCDNGMYRLKKISKSIFLRFNESLPESDYDDFYSIANMTLWQAFNSYDSSMGISFEIFLKTCLKKKFITEIIARHREKRVVNQLSISLDATDEMEEDYSLLDMIPSDSDTFNEVLERQGKGKYSDKVQMYISRLSKIQVDILNLLMDGYRPVEIRKILDITEKDYSKNMQTLRAFENVKVLF